MKYAVVAVLACVLSACATPIAVKPIDAAAVTLLQQRAALLAAIDDWRVNGRVAIVAGHRAWQAHIDWQQRLHAYEILISTPLGSGIGRLQGDSDSALLTTAEHGELQARDAQTLLQRQFGWQIPVNSLRYWLRGLADPALPALPYLDANGRLGRLLQDGWDIEFLRYTSVDNVELPDKLALTHADVRVKFIIETWQLNR